MVDITKTLRLTVTRAYAPTKDQRTANILASFSLDVMCREAANKPWFRLGCLNDLTLRSTRSDGEESPRLWISSMAREGTRGKSIYAVSFFPGGLQDALQRDRQNQFVSDLIPEIKTFIDDIQTRGEVSRTVDPSTLPEAARDLLDLGKASDEAKAKRSSKTKGSDDMPF